ncbi:MAG: hypothetical protein ACP5JG_13565 [Anaerolineae bacterium]
MTSSRLSQFCDRALEAGWLLGVTITPVFFNVYSDRVFEPDKLTTLRSLAMVMAVLWMTRFIEERVREASPIRFSLRTPMVLPALLTMVVYLISTLFSLVPYTSLIGSYQRLQGTYTLLGYLVVFLAILTSLRTRVQLSRLITVLILNSLPISLYGIIQHNGLDPLPWAGDVMRRVAANMGNAIFVAAYLIMIVPLTAARIVQSFGDILGREEARISDVLRASGYIFVFAVQLLTIWYSQSRGPWLGIVASGFLFPYLALIVLQRQAIAEDGAEGGKLGDALKGFGFGLGSLALAGALTGLAFLVLRGPWAAYIGLGLAALVFGGLWLHFIVERKGWRWLWIGWGSVGLIIAVALILVNVPGPLQTQVRGVESLRRLTTITELQSGTGKVRGLIWQGTVDLLSIHEPILYPDGTPDRYNWLRPLVGYGPESMYVAYNSFYPPELGRYESRTASPDRSHNETLDSMVFSGILGLGVYLFTFVGFFSWGFHWLGLLSSRRQLLTYIGLDAFFAVLLFIIGWQLEGAYLFAVAIPLGVLIGTMVYLTWQAFAAFFETTAAATEDTAAVHPHSLILMGVLAGVIAHFVEINFGIAIASTRTTFWAFAGLLAVLGLTWVPGRTSVLDQISESSEPDPSPDRRRRRRFSRARSSGALLSPWRAAVLALGLSAAFLLGTLAFDFVNNPGHLTKAGEIFIGSLITRQVGGEATRSYGALMIFVFTWMLYGVIGLGELDREGVFDVQRDRRWPRAIAIYAGVSLVGLLIFGGLIAGHQAALSRTQVTTVEELVDVGVALTGLLGRYYGLVFTVLVLMGLVLMQEERRPRSSGSVVGYAVLTVLILVSVVAIREGSYNLISADVIYKQGKTFANGRSINEKQIGIQHYERAIEYAPREDYYYLFLGKAYLELAQGLPDDTPREQREAIFLETEEILIRARQLNPLNTDHSANLARFYKSWAARVAIQLQGDTLSEEERARLLQQRQELLTLSLERYDEALTLSPNNPILWNELAQLYVIDIGDQQKYEETIQASLDLDEKFEQTWILIGQIRSSQNDLAGALEAYGQALEIKNDCAVRGAVGRILVQQAKWDEAVDALETSIAECDRSGVLWELYHLISIAYANQGRLTQAMDAAETALMLAPESQKPAIQEVIDQLEARGQPQPAIAP